ncbi:MAG: serine/threonine protein kinase [Chloroflexi bacterium]|nr:serine/threonine protein kinase [Chloroflexota bacterium]
MEAQHELRGVAQIVCEQLGLRLDKYIAKGAFKETYSVYSSRGEHFALKVYMNEARSEREEREVEAMQRCDHPNIAKCTKIGQVSQYGRLYSYLLEDFIDGGRLTDRIAKAYLSVNELIEIGVPLIDALGHIASHNLVHRDLKPDNILFGSDGQSPVITDFGLVRDLSATSLTHTWYNRGPGTPYYASPEQLNNEKHMLDWRSDQFGLGVTLTMCATGVHPYGEAGDTSMSAVVDLVSQRRGPSQTFMDWTQRTGLDALAKMVSPYPADRFRRAADLSIAWLKQQKAR